jgi:hypothetical protein
MSPALKRRIERLAAGEHLSVNAYLVRQIEKIMPLAKKS